MAAIAMARALRRWRTSNTSRSRPAAGWSTASALAITHWLTDLEVTVEGGDGVADELSRPSEVKVDQGLPHVSIKVLSDIKGFGCHLPEEALATAVDESHHPVGDVAQPVGEVLIRPGDDALDREVGVDDRADVTSTDWATPASTAAIS